MSIDRDDTIFELAKVTDILSGDIIGRLALLFIAGFINAEHEWSVIQHPFGQFQSLLADVSNIPGRVREKM